MRVGILARGDIEELDWVHSLGFGALEWIRFDQSAVGLSTRDWQPPARALAAEAAQRGLRISAIGALYANPLDPKQTEYAGKVFRRAIEVAAEVGVKTVAGFPGAVIETEWNERGGNLVYRPFEGFLPQLLAFWEPVARYAADRGVQIAFEHSPQGIYHLPVMGYNMLAQPAMWERLFNATSLENIGLEWDPSHLVCQLIDPVQNIRRFGTRIFHVHAKDAFVDRDLLATYGICHPGVTEHRFPGLGQSNWGEIVRALLRAGYNSDLTIEGWHDPVYRNHPEGSAGGRLAGRRLENTGVLIAKKTLEGYLPPE
ncbi:MAG: sugar phosphate isomerase/epimerase [Verrucomicrobiota bacterium]